MKGGCHCGAVRYETVGEPIVHSICHCSDCRRHAGAPMVSWVMFPQEQVSITKGATKAYASSAHVIREFCAECGTGLFYRNASVLPGIVDVQSGTLDDPNQLPPQCHVQTAERLSWLSSIHTLTEFERFPPQA